MLEHFEDIKRWVLLSDENVFIHVPKVAGTTIRHVLRQLKWERYRDVEGGMTQKHVDGFKFAFVRNPWDRMVSAYHFAKSQQLPMLSRPFIPNDNPRRTKLRFRDEQGRDCGYSCVEFTTFENFVLHDACLDGEFTNDHWRAQSDFITDDDKMIVDFVGRFENLQEDFNEVCKHIGTGVWGLQHKMGTEHKPYATYYTNELIESVAQQYERDIELFGYEFGK